jgi:hypothetical protein
VGIPAFRIFLNGRFLNGGVFVDVFGQAHDSFPRKRLIFSANIKFSGDFCQKAPPGMNGEVSPPCLFSLFSTPLGRMSSDFGCMRWICTVFSLDIPWAFLYQAVQAGFCFSFQGGDHESWVLHRADHSFQGG